MPCDPQLALSLARASADAYDAQALQHADKVIERDDILCAIISSRRAGHPAGQTFVVFRGTKDVRNWLTDLDCEMTYSPIGRIHRGFWEAFSKIEEDLRIALAQYRGDTIFCGHSLGGALAVIAAKWFSAGRGSVWTFGQPRVGDRRFADSLDFFFSGRYFRCVAPGDVVPCVPYLLASFRHGGQEMFLTEANKGNKGAGTSFPSFPSVPFFRKLKCEVRANYHALRHHRFTPLTAHAISNYQSLLAA